MRIDAYTHFIPKKFFNEIIERGGHADIGKRVREIPCIHDVNVRLKVVDKFKDYAQIVSYPMPPLEIMASNAKQVEDYRAGKEKAFNSLVGQVMKATKGKANPAQVNEILKRKLAG